METSSSTMDSPCFQVRVGTTLLYWQCFFTTFRTKVPNNEAYVVGDLESVLHAWNKHRFSSKQATQLKN